MTLEEAIVESREKWKEVQRCLAELSKAVYRNCSFCTFYRECTECPLGETRDGLEGKGCVKYGVVTNALEEQQDKAAAILDVINSVKVCKHKLELEITMPADDIGKRFFICSDCGRHRLEEEFC